MTKKGGKIFIFEAFNPYPYNVFTKYINLEKLIYFSMVEIFFNKISEKIFS